jgi:hypothetical protein
MQAASSARRTLEKSLRQAARSIAVSFDDWTANDNLYFLDVTAHYIGAPLRPHTMPFGFWNIRGSHSGESIAVKISRTMHKYNLHDKVHYPKADNAIANDRAIKVSSDSLPPPTLWGPSYQSGC